MIGNIIYYRFIPESPRWLLVKNKQDSAMKIINDIAKGNGKPLPSNIKAQAQVGSTRSKVHVPKYFSSRTDNFY